jgi:O-acetyl-ADP-ribose deacetylase (regulator of RNase III)
MITFKTGNIFEEDSEAIVNTVNCVGIMGRGIALQFKKKYPANFKAYAEAAKHSEIIPGKMFVFENNKNFSPKYIINFPTKRHWRDKSRISDIQSGLQALAETIQKEKIQSIALPPLGCGLGGLNWDEVRQLIVNTFEKLSDINIIVFEPNEQSASLKLSSHEEPQMTAGRAALIELIHRYINGLLDPFVTLIEIHKLMYFLQEAGESLRLNYKQHHYGPYAENLRHVLNKIEGHFITGYADGGDTPNKFLSLLPGAYEKASAFLSSHRDTHERYNKVADLVDGFETPFGLELLATVHWVITHNLINSQDDVIKYTYAWNERKKQFTPTQINLAIDVLSNKGWIKTSSWKN